MTIPEMSRLLDSVYLLLQKSVSPMRPKELAAALIQRGMWQSQGKTPDATVGARIYEDIKSMEINPGSSRRQKGSLRLTRT